MAEIVLAIGCAHAPQLHTPIDRWVYHAKRDTEDAEPLWYKGERLKYADLVEQRKEQNLAEQADVGVFKERIARSHAAINRISQVFVPLAVNANDAMNLIDLSDLANPKATGWKTCAVRIKKA